MLNIPAPIRVFLCTRPTDMRKQFDGLHGLVIEVLRQNPLSGDWFVFFNKRRDRIKVLAWEGDGLSIWYKKLESHYPRFFLFTETGESADNFARRPASAGRMASVSTRIGPWRRPMPREITVTAPPRAQFPDGP